MLSFCALAGAAACATEKAPPSDDLAGAVPGGKSDHTSIGLVGWIDFGESTSAIYHEYPPRYLALAFTAGGGDTVDLRVWSTSGGDPVAWLLDDSGALVAWSDDESAGSLSSHIQVALPAGAARTHFAVFRDYYDEPGSFQVSLDGEQDWLGCQRDSDCARVEAGCCQVGDYVAIRADRVDAFRDSLECDGTEVCPPPPAYRGETAVCDNNNHTCEVLLPDEIQCGGFMTNPHACPPGWECVGPDLALDGTGECAQVCGGFGDRPCPAGQTCEDNPYDDCDPSAGGADCSGICLGD